jgi:hypothetical protein
MGHSLQGGSIQVEIWNEEKFAASRSEWQDLLLRSGADALFMSWDWQWRWWYHVGRAMKSTLVLFAGYDANRVLRGLAPFHLRKVSHRPGITGYRLESLGSTFRESTEVFTEYVDFIVDAACADTAGAALAHAVRADTRWTDLVIGNTAGDGVAVGLVRQQFQDCYVREVDHLDAHAVQLPADFSEYLKALPGGIRRKVWNQRSKIPGARLNDVGDIGSFLDSLDGFHSRRWGHPHYLGARRDFHLDFASAAAERGDLRMSHLSVDGKVISAMYDIRAGGSERNLQAGFDSTITGFSPGYLHFGFAMERACADRVPVFDFLSGKGRSRQYKQDFLTTARPLTTMHVLRSAALRWVYRGYDRFKSLTSKFSGEQDS